MAELPLNLRKWLIGVGDKLNDEGQQLLKLLYYRDIQHAPLVDEVNAPKDLFEFSRSHAARSDEATLALFIHHLSLLIPRDQPDAEDPEKIMKVKDLGAQACVDHLSECDLSQPTIRVDVSQESKLLECLVTVYVNVSQWKRKELKQQLAEQVSVNSENFGIFELFCRLFQKAGNRVPEILDGFVNALDSAPAPSPVVENLICQLDTYHIPHTLTADEINTQDESINDYIGEAAALTILQEEVHPIYKPRLKCTKRRITHCIVGCIPFALVLLSIAVSIATLSTYNKTDEREFEVSSLHQHCNGDVDTGVPLIRLGSVNSFWYKDILIVQDVDSKVYKDVAVDIFFVPSDFVVERTREFSCSLFYEKGVLLELDQLYLLQGSILSFNICVKSIIQDSPGFVNLNFYDDNIDFYSDMFFHQQQFCVAANQVNCSNYNFTATRDSLYYTKSCDSDCNSTSNSYLTFYKIDAELKYISYTHWANTSYSTSVCQLDVLTKECLITTDIGKKWFFSAKTYDVFANVTSGSTKLGPVGHLKVQPSFRSTVYAVPTVIGGILLAIVYICCGVGCCVNGIKGQRREDQELEHMH